MIWTILLFVAGFSILAFLLIYIIPFGIYAAYSYSANKLTAAAFLLHSSLCRFEYDIADNSIRARLFGFVFWSSKKDGGSNSDKSDKIDENTSKEPDINESDSENEDMGSAPINFEHGSFESDESNQNFRKSAADVKPQSGKKTSSDDKPKSSKRKKNDEKTDETTASSDNDEKKENGPKQSLIDKIKKNPVVFFVRSEPLRNKAIRWVIEFTKRTVKIIKIERCMINMSFAMDDPSVSGKIYGYTEALRHALGLYSRRINVVFVPQFEKTYNTINCEVRISTSLFRLSRPAILALLTFPYYTFAVTWWRYRNMIRQGRDNNEKHS